MSHINEASPRIGWSDAEAAAIRRNAQRQADTAEQLVQQISRQRLAELKRAPAAAAVNVVDDLALTASDRVALVQHLARVGVRQPTATRRRRTIGRFAGAIARPSRILRRLRVRDALALIGAFGLAVPVALAWQATPVRRVTLARDAIVDWYADGRYAGMVGYPAGAQFDAVRNDATSERIIVRGWMPQRGYVIGAIAYNDLRIGRSR